MSSLKNKCKSELSKLNFKLGRNPKIENSNRQNDFIPPDYQAVITITADFELAWSWRYSKQFENPYNEAIYHARIERKNVPKLINLCELYQIPITWATVGHLFLESCSATEGHKHPEIGHVPNYTGKYWDFKSNDWFEHDPCSNYKVDPEWYAPDLINEILQSNVKHEIGCHTFSHIDCRESVCSKELFENELNKCKLLAKKKSLTLKSFVHPGHNIGNLDSLMKLGFSSFQTGDLNLLSYPIKHSNGLWELKRTMIFDYRPEWSINYHIYRYRKIIDRTLNKNLVCNFWFHPSVNTIFIDEILPEIFSYIAKRADKLWIGSVKDYVEILNTNS